MSCTELEPLLAYRPLEVLDDDEAVALEGHLAECERCRARVESLEASYRPLAEEVSSDVPEELWAAVKSQLDQESAEPAPAPARDLELVVHCAFCHDGLRRPEAVYCAACLAPHHADCFRAHGRCSTLGCEETHFVRPQAEPLVAPTRSPRWAALAASLVVGLGMAAWGLTRPGKDVVQASRPDTGVEGAVTVVEDSMPADVAVVGPLVVDVAVEDSVVESGTSVGEPGGRPVPAGRRRRPIVNPARVLSGMVLRVTGELAQLSLGTDDGVREGDEFTVWRGEDLVGRLAVETLGAGATMARSTEGEVQVGDTVLLANEDMFAGEPLNGLSIYYEEGPPRWEYRFLRDLALGGGARVGLRLLSADPGWDPEVDGLTVFSARPEFVDHDVVIVGDRGPLAPSELEWLEDHVRAGGGLVLMPGAAGLDAALHALSPVVDGGWVAGETSPLAQVADHAAVAALYRTSDRVGLPRLEGVRPGEAADDTCRVLAALSDGRPLIAVRELGQGRVVYVGTDDLWRWRAATGLYRGVWIDLLDWVSGRVDQPDSGAAAEAPPSEVEAQQDPIDQVELLQLILFAQRGQKVICNGRRYKLGGYRVAGWVELSPVLPGGGPVLGLIRIKLEDIKSFQLGWPD